MGPTGIVFDIQRFSLHDGPGIRTTVFLKGCPLSCWWCHNPESISGSPQLVLFESKCIGCGRCFLACPHGAQTRLPDGSRTIDRGKCEVCGACAEGCYAEALVVEGRRMEVGEALEEVRRDLPFYAGSGGGVTLSGGEPLRQREFAAALLAACRADGMHTAIDTSGYAPWAAFEEVLPSVDLVLFDLKHMDPGTHERYTGVPNDLILSNLRRLDAGGARVEVRMPIVPGVNDADADIDAAGSFLQGLRNLQGVKLLPYHRLGEGKYGRLGKTYGLPGVEPPSREKMKEIAGRLAARGLPVRGD